MSTVNHASRKYFAMDELVENKTYYAKYISISHRGGKILVENDFTETNEDNGYCWNHNIPVVKLNGVLKAKGDDLPKDIPFEGFNKWGIEVHGPGSTEKFMNTAIELHVNGTVHHEYYPYDLPPGAEKWTVPWGIKRTASGLVLPNTFTLGSNRGTAELPLRGGNGVIYITQTAYDKFKGKYGYEQVSHDDSIVDGTAYGSNDTLQFLKSKGAYIGESCSLSNSIPVQIVPQ